MRDTRPPQSQTVVRLSSGLRPVRLTKPKGVGGPTVPWPNDDARGGGLLQYTRRPQVFDETIGRRSARSSHRSFLSKGFSTFAVRTYLCVTRVSILGKFSYYDLAPYHYDQFTLSYVSGYIPSHPISSDRILPFQPIF